MLLSVSRREAGEREHGRIEGKQLVRFSDLSGQYMRGSGHFPWIPSVSSYFSRGLLFLSQAFECLSATHPQIFFLVPSLAACKKVDAEGHPHPCI